MFIQIQDMLMLFDSALCLWRPCIKKSAIVIIKYLGRGVGGQGIICKSKVLQFTRTNKRCFKLLTIVQLTVPSDATLLEDPSEPFF